MVRTTGYKVSLIVPVYNAERFLKERLDSIEAQTLNELEVIFVDDGSTDNSGEMLLDFRNKHPETVRVITQQNQFAGVARNNGLKEASGDYVAFWDADDFSEPDQLEKLYEAAIRTGADISLCDMSFYDQTNDSYRTGHSVINKKLLPEGRDTFTHDELESVIFNAFSFHSPNKLFRREFLLSNDIWYKPWRIAEDTIFIMKALYLAGKIVVVDEPLYCYRVNVDGNNLTSGISGDILSNVRAYKEFREYLISAGKYNDAVKRSFANKALAGIVRHMEKTDTYESYVRMYDYLTEENGLEELDLTNNEASYYYKEADYNKLMALTGAADVNEYLFWSYKQKQETIRQKDIKLRNLREKLKKTKDALKQIKSSRSYRIGKKITSIIPHK